MNDNKAFVLYDLQNIFKKALAIAPNIHLDLLYDQKQYYPLLISLRQILSVYRILKRKYQVIPVFVNDYGQRKRGDYKKNRYTVSGKYIFEENMKAIIRKQLYDSSITISDEIDLEQKFKEWKKYQFDKLKEFCKIFETYISAYEIEADEVIAYIIHHYKNNGISFYIVSSDKDFLQLTLLDNVFLMDIRKRKKQIIHKNMWKIEEYVTQRLFGKKGYINLPLELFVTGQAIFGDKADNVVGLKGIGNKYAQQILEKLIPYKEQIERYTLRGDINAIWDLILTETKDMKNLYKRINGQNTIFTNNFKEVNLVSEELLIEKITPARVLDIQKSLLGLDDIMNLSFYQLLVKNSKQYKQLIQFIKDIERPSLLQYLQ